MHISQLIPAIIVGFCVGVSHQSPVVNCNAVWVTAAEKIFNALENPNGPMLCSSVLSKYQTVTTTAVTYTSTTTIAAATTITDLSSTTVTITTQAPVVATHTQAPIIGGLPSKKKRSLGDDGLVKRDDPHAVIAQALNIATSLVSGFCSCEAPGPTSTATLTVTTPALATTTSTATAHATSISTSTTTTTTTSTTTVTGAHAFALATQNVNPSQAVWFGVYDYDQFSTGCPDNAANAGCAIQSCADSCENAGQCTSFLVQSSFDGSSWGCALNSQTDISTYAQGQLYGLEYIYNKQ